MTNRRSIIIVLLLRSQAFHFLNWNVIKPNSFLGEMIYWILYKAELLMVHNRNECNNNNPIEYELQCHFEWLIRT